jgi:hypothetical protein
MVKVSQAQSPLDLVLLFALPSPQLCDSQSDSDTDDEEEMIPGPMWAEGAQLRMKLMQQMYQLYFVLKDSLVFFL